MKFTRLSIPDIILLEPHIYNDERGYFFESFNQKIFNKIVGANINFVQDNISYSKRGVIRGLHAQSDPFSQGKLVQVLDGEVYDVAVDIRTDSPTYNSSVGVRLCSNKKNQLWIPSGFAHGFMALSDTVIFSYKVTNYYSKENEIYFNWNSNNFNIDWPDIGHKIVTSKKDSL